MTFDCYCKSDIHRAFYEARDGDTINISPGRYPFDPGDLILRNLKWVTINTSRVSFEIQSHGTGLKIQNCYELVINGLIVVGNGYIDDPLPLYFALFEFSGVNSWITLNDCIAVGSGNHGFAHLNGPRTSDHLTFNRCKVIYCGHLNNPNPMTKQDGAGFAFGGQWIVYNDCYTEGCYRGWEFESGDFPERHPTRHIELNRCSAYRNLYQNITVMRFDGRADLCSDIKIKRFTAEGWGDSPGTPFASGNIGVYWGGGSDSVIEDSSFLLMHDGIGIQIAPEFADTYGLRILNNTFHDLYRPAIFMGNQDSNPEKRKMRDVTIRSNTVRRIMGSHGMWLRKAALENIVEIENDIAEVGPNCLPIFYT